jgi:hypothetical protein
VPKREIFDRSNFPDFYAIKSSWVGDLVVKMLTYFLIFEGAKPHLASGAHAEHTRKELLRMLSMRISLGTFKQTFRLLSVKCSFHKLYEKLKIRQIIDNNSAVFSFISKNQQTTSFCCFFQNSAQSVENFSNWKNVL